MGQKGGGGCKQKRQTVTREGRLGSEVDFYSDVINERTLSKRRSKDEKSTFRLRGGGVGVAKGDSKSLKNK